ncbi:MAG TPA: DUF4276 family protein [Thermoanaerobaculia bacterium]|nr:DUF4276 family protein [Thermoanaerobaculia bacterium]
MVREIRIYVEGGGRGRTSRSSIRDGLSDFFSPLIRLARDRRIAWKVIPSGSRTDTFASFALALSEHPQAFNVLLVDSECGVTLPRWEHLRRQDGWYVPDLNEDHCHLMVQTIEAWLIADPEALVGFYGQGFLQGALPSRQDVEAIAKDDLMRALDRATVRTQKGRYHKISHCADLLGRLDPERVRARARHCDLLFTTLEARIRGTVG